VTALDITKNQAAATVADSTEENGETINEKPGHAKAENIGRRNARPVTV
jgi:hypothetical protein